ncbi:MAG: outer membrane protein OmpA-like peptidoglycan-associated protein [Saprospiraceae bacterium]|jgi:outer membrane protein OmpA-like peptidoglycan-associated protein
MDAEHAAVLEGAPFSYYFESDIERLDKKDMKKFISEIQKIELQYIANISVTGYTDNTDSQEYNDVLSTARAETILEVIK